MKSTRYDIASNYHTEGYLRGSFAQSPELSSIISSLDQIQERNLKTGYSLNSKYQNTYDLRPNAVFYDENFLNILNVSNIPKILSQCISPDVVLYHLQIRISRPGRTYTGWHRDSYIYNNVKQGNFPPVHKLIFYPIKLAKYDVAPTLSMIRGSSRTNFNNKLLDKLYLLNSISRKSNVINYCPSPTDFLLFNTESMHIARSSKATNIRIIYNFIRESQLESVHNHIHKETVSRYKDLCL